MKISKALRINDLLLRKSSILKLIFFTFFFFFCGCQEEKKLSDLISNDEREDLTYFLRQIIDNESGAYVLFGSKPLCTGFLKDLSAKAEKGWKAWEKVQNSILANHYILVKKPFTLEMTASDQGKMNVDLQFIVFADVKKTALVLAENYDHFKNLTGIDFHPLEIVFELENPDSIFWNQIFNLDERSLASKEKLESHIACGLLFGFGKANSLLFAWKAEALEKGGKSDDFFKRLHSSRSLEELGENNLFWTRFLNERGVNAFLIPGFIAFESDEITEQYKKERKKIQAIYRGRDFLEVTLRQLCKTAL